MICEGGPMNGMDHESRTTGSLLLTRKETGQAIVYRREGDRLVAGPVVDLDRARAVQAALDPAHDVRAYSAEVMGPWPS